MASNPNLRTSGRKPGSRNRLQGRFIDALASDFEQNGGAVIRICRIEQPVQYLKVIASVLPKEFIVSDNAIDEMGEDELLQVLEEIRKARAAATAH